MNNIGYRDFLSLVLAAAGPFSYRFADSTLTCWPEVYIPLHWRSRAALEGALRRAA
jgi:hypothetical protein